MSRDEEESCFKPVPKLTLSVCEHENEIVPLENALLNMNEVLKNLTLNAHNKVIGRRVCVFAA